MANIVTENNKFTKKAKKNFDIRQKVQGINLPWPLNYQIGLYKVKYFKNRNKNTQLGFSVEWKKNNKYRKP